MTLLLALQPSLQGDMWAWLARAARDKIASVPSFLTVLTQVEGTGTEPANFIISSVSELLYPSYLAPDFGLAFFLPPYLFSSFHDDLPGDPVEA